MQSFRDLKVWDMSHKLTLDVYRATTDFPRDELFDMTSQLRRAVSSIPANIAEGCGRGGTGEFSRFMQIAMGPASETEYFLLLARDLSFLTPADYENLNDSITQLKRMLASLIKSARSVPKTNNTHQPQLTTDN
jgi:four helix bundle protein